MKDKAVELLQSSISSSNNCTGTNSSASDVSSTSTFDNTITPKQSNIFSSCYDKPRATKPALDEVMVWLQSDFDYDITNDDLLSFWRQKRNDFPNIARIARKVLAIPASNTSVERLFSSTKTTVGDRRTKLGTEKIDKLMFLQKNLNPLKNLFDLKSDLTTHQSKRKPDDKHDDNNEDCTSKKAKANEEDEYEYEYELLSDDYESEKEN